MTSILRQHTGHSHAKVTFVELFFDLVFVFAITQLSHLLMGNFSAGGFLRVGILFPGIWWVWMFTSWVTNWMDPDKAAGRILMFGLMAGGLILSAAIPTAFGARGDVFAGAYFFMQVGRSLFFLLLVCKEDLVMRKNFQRITVWLVASGALWLIGGFGPPEKRVAWWLAALALEYAGPLLFFYTPGLGRSTIADWKVDGAHMAERCALFIIIALGESLLVSGATFAGLDWSGPVLVAFGASFAGAVAMWWLYFDAVSDIGTRVMTTTAETGKLARLAYTYIHLPIVAGIILSAVADEFTLSHPGGAGHGHTGANIVIATIAGNALYLLGGLLFRRVMTGHLFLSSLTGILVLFALVPCATFMPAHLFMLAANGVLVAVAVFEKRSAKQCPAFADV